MTKIQNMLYLKIEISAVLVIGVWNLRFICNLVLEIWDFFPFYQPPSF